MEVVVRNLRRCHEKGNEFIASIVVKKTNNCFVVYKKKENIIYFFVNTYQTVLATRSFGTVDEAFRLMGLVIDQAGLSQISQESVTRSMTTRLDERQDLCLLPFSFHLL